MPMDGLGKYKQYVKNERYEEFIVHGRALERSN